MFTNFDPLKETIDYVTLPEDAIPYGHKKGYHINIENSKC